MSPRKVKGSTQQGKRINKKSRRTSEVLADSLADDMEGVNLSRDTRELLVKFKTSKHKDPFDSDHQAIIDKLTSTAKNIDRNERLGVETHVNLKEAGLLLECSTVVYTEMVNTLRRDVNRVAQRILANKYGSRKINPTEESIPESEKGENSCPSGATVEDNKLKNSHINQETLPDEPKQLEQESSTGPEGDDDCSSDLQGTVITSEGNVISNNNSTNTVEVITIDDEEPETQAATQTPLAEVSMLSDTPAITKALLSQSAITTAENDSESSPPRKRPKIDYGLPPVLTPYFEESFEVNNSDAPPLLQQEKLLKRRVPQTSQMKEPVDKAQKVKLCEGTTENVPEVLTNLKRRHSSGSNPNEPTITTQIPDVIPLPEGVVIKIEKPDVDNCIVPLGLSSANPTGFGNFTPADEAEIQNFINKLHYLPFTCELSNQELEKTFESTVERLESIYKEHNVQIFRHVATATSQACAHISSSYAKWLETDKNMAVPDPTVVHELFYQRIREQQGHHSEQNESELTIMERTQEKTRVESDFKIKEMLAEIRKHIVPRYTKIPLIEENTEGFFRRVRSFENRMKKILADNENKGKFDIREYEMEILDVTEKESKELNDDEVEPNAPLLSPVMSPPSGSISPVQFHFDGLPSPSSSDSSSKSGVKWISLTKIFSHMKTLSHHEVSRMFYAVLALLSFQNLDINYDNYYSAESASLVAKNLDHDQDTKYPRGLKIMSSRCPNADTDEIYIAISTTKSREEIFKDLEYHQKEFESQQEPLIEEEQDKVANPEISNSLHHQNILELCKELRVNIIQDPLFANKLTGLNGLLAAANSFSKIAHKSSSNNSLPRPTKNNKSKSKCALRRGSHDTKTHCDILEL